MGSTASAGAAAAAPTAPRPAETTTSIARPVPALVEALSGLARTIRGYGGDLGVAVLDVGTGELLAAHNDRRLLNPASNAKVFTAAAALSLLHGNYRYETALYGEQRGASVAKLVLRGQGDPSLCTKDLWDLVRDLREEGVRKIEGDIYVDQRFFDENFVPPAFEQQPNEWAYFRAPVSAIALNENTVTMIVRPGGADGAALVSFDPPGFVDIDGTIHTSNDDRPQNIRLELSPSGERLLARVAGSIPKSAPPMRFTRRVDNPMLLAGYALKSLLTNAGIQVAGDVRLGAEPVKASLAMHRSRPLSALLYELGKQSNNFYAEMVFKTLGAERRGRPGRAANASDVLARFLNEVGAFEEGTIFKNGSGLFDADRVSAGATVRLLRAAYRDPTIGPEFVAQLAVGGVDGTLHGRFVSEKEHRSVRAKTGTLESIAALSGYVMGPAGKSPVAFSMLVNDIPGKVSGARAAIDKCVDSIVRYQWSRAENPARGARP